LIYVTSDLHGISPKRFFSLLEKGGFGQGERDFLYILGDVIDRGEHGVELLHWIFSRPDVQLLRGNHEQMLLDCAFLFELITEDSISELDTEQMDLVATWLFNGAEPTLEALRDLYRQSPELFLALIEELSDTPLLEAVTAGGRDFLLTHAGLGGFSPDKRFSDYTPHQLLWSRPSAGDRYFDHITTVFGHTPTQTYGKEYAGRMFETATWIDIDTGSAFGGTPMLLRLDDMEAFYL